jgi:small subunit ribosomal protein S6
MREYELTVVYDLAVQEAGGPDASVELLTNFVTARGGKVLKVDHWGRRRMAYPINRAIDGDYLVTRVELDPVAVAPLEAALMIDERVFRHLVVRADELPIPPPPREPRREPAAAAAGPAAAAPAEPAAEVAQAPEAAAPAAAAAEAEAPSAEEAPAPAAEETPPEATTPAVDEAEAPSAEAAPAPAAEEPAEAVADVADVTGVTEEPADTAEAAALGAAEASPEPVEAPGEETDEGKAPPSGTIATDESV